MGIRFTKYVRITSGVIGQSSVPAQSFCLRLFSHNPVIPVGTVIEFDTLGDVGTFFGFATNDYLRAVPYFGFVSKQIKQANKIQYARWVDTAQAAMIFGNTTPKSLATYTAIGAGGFTLSIGGVPFAMTAINLSAAADLATVAADIQTKIRTGTGSQFTAATVTYNGTTNQFLFTSGSAVAAAISVTDGAENVAAALGWTTGTGLVLSPGAAVEGPDAAYTNCQGFNDDYGSFVFMPPLTQTQAAAVAGANYAFNNAYLDCLAIAAANATAWQTAMGTIGGIAPTLSPLSLEYPEQIPSQIFAATDYTQPNAAQNYMYQVANSVTPSVTDDTDANTYDALSINYYGQTMKNGRKINFYQDGVLWGNGTTDVEDIGIYCNEIWFKSAMGTMFINLQLALTQIPADDQGRRLLLANSIAIINQAKGNGVIQVSKTLSPIQIAAVFQATNDPLAYVQVQSQGFWLDWVIAPFTNELNGDTQYMATYTLVYAKGDSIRVITGTDNLV